MFWFVKGDVANIDRGLENMQHGAFRHKWRFFNDVGAVRL